ncbi:interferon regulatory factor 1-like [Dendronephthya gigantea]|uniref:interferon regulatory factor 1-like n=1 Tax=Dendronephthya gigantea TaxID=151771 RepID=UPI00106B40A9|nr:interferon regulatory factor 1-like [Dendronephthya gigantea]
MALSKPLRKPRFKDWLVHVLDNDLCSEDAKWKDRNRRTAIIRWPHKSRGTWTLEKDANLFRMWAITSGKYRTNIDKPNPKSWKCNFRMNLNICRNIVELREERIPKGPHACRVFKFLDHRTLVQTNCSFAGMFQYERSRYQLNQADGFEQVMMHANQGSYHNGAIHHHGLQDIDPTLTSITNTGNYPYSDIGEIPEQVMDDICSLSQQPACSGANFTDLVSPANQDHPLNFHHAQTTSERPAPDQNHSLQRPSACSELKHVTSAELVEQDPFKKKIDSLKATELNKMADIFGGAADTYVNI